MISVFGTSPSVFEQLSEWWGKSISIRLLAFTPIQAGVGGLINTNLSSWIYGEKEVASREKRSFCNTGKLRVHLPSQAAGFA